MNTSAIELPLTCEVNGRTWSLFGLNYTTADGEFSTYFYAISFEHAGAIVEEIRQSARLGGQLVGWTPA